MANVSNYSEQGGAVKVIGGELKIASGGSITAAGTQASKISDIAITYTANDPSITANQAVTVADGSAATVVELLELVEELIANQNAIIDVIEGAGLAAAS